MTASSLWAATNTDTLGQYFSTTSGANFLLLWYLAKERIQRSTIAHIDNTIKNEILGVNCTDKTVNELMQQISQINRVRSTGSVIQTLFN